MIFNDTMTVYNFTSDKWYRTVVKGIQWRHTRHRMTLTPSGTYTLADDETITVDFSKDNGYVEPEAYTGEGWTLDVSTKKDVVVFGIAEEEITDDYTIAQLLKQYRGKSGIVRSVTDARNRPYLPIIKVVAN